MSKRSPAAPVNELRSPCWLLRGISSIPGELVLRESAVSFVATHSGSALPWQLRKLEQMLGTDHLARALDDGEPIQALEWSVREIQAWCPWYYFGAGLKIRRGNVEFHFSFGEPGNERLSGRPTNLLAALPQIVATLQEVRSMRSVGAVWKAALESAAIEVRDDV
jgi:hypothetical protein